MSEQHPMHEECLHDADWETARACGLLRDDGCSVTVQCRHCGMVAEVDLAPADFRWEDTFRRLDEDLATPPGPDPEREAMEEYSRYARGIWQRPEHEEHEDPEHEDEEEDPPVH
jgi:hypothetical protein